MTNEQLPSSHTNSGPQSQEEVVVTALGNPAHPEGAYGAQMLERMNQSHNSVTNWGLDFVDFSSVSRALDVGCGGGATIARLLSRMEAAHQASTASADKNLHGQSSSRQSEQSGAEKSLCADGVDISETSVKASLAYNAGAVLKGQVHVWQASVEDLPLESDSYDLLTTVESFYFWPDPVAGIAECRRLLRPGGTMALICDVYENGKLSDEARANIATYSMRVPTPAQFENYFTEAGFSKVTIQLHSEDSWICVLATK